MSYWQGSNPRYATMETIGQYIGFAAFTLMVSLFIVASHYLDIVTAKHIKDRTSND